METIIKLLLVVLVFVILAPVLFSGFVVFSVILGIFLKCLPFIVAILVLMWIFG